jgi:hypothetical protein
LDPGFQQHFIMILPRAVLFLSFAVVVAADITVHTTDDGQIMYMSHREIQKDPTTRIEVDGSSVYLVSDSHGVFESFTVPDDFDANSLVTADIKFSAPDRCTDCAGVYYVSANRGDIDVKRFRMALHSDISAAGSVLGGDFFQNLFGAFGHNDRDEDADDTKGMSFFPGLIGNMLGGESHGFGSAMAVSDLDQDVRGTTNSISGN